MEFAEYLPIWDKLTSYQKEAVANAEGVIDPATEVAITYGNTIAIILDFIIIAFAVFCMVKALNNLHRKKEEPAPEPEPEPEPEEKTDKPKKHSSFIKP